MVFNIVLTKNARDDVLRIHTYLLDLLQNEQAARNFIDDLEKISRVLYFYPSSLPLCKDGRLQDHGYRKTHFRKLRFFLLYRVEDDTVIIDGVFHNSEDIENKAA